MNALKVKNFLWKQGLTVSSMARFLHDNKKYDASFHSLRTMLTNLLYHEKYNAELARVVKQEFGLEIPKTGKAQTVKEAVRQAA